MFLLEESCLQGWFPCSETFTGNLFLVLVYALILAFASKLIAEGSELLMEVLDNPGIVGGLILPVLGALPDVAIIVASSLGDTAEEAQQELWVGMGTLAGSDVLILTIPWCIGVIVGRCDIDPSTGEAIDGKCSPWTSASLQQQGITLSSSVKRTAAISLITVIPFLLMQIGNIYAHAVLHSHTNDAIRKFALVSVIVCVILFIGYSIFAYYDDKIQAKRLKFARRMHIIRNVIGRTSTKITHKFSRKSRRKRKQMRRQQQEEESELRGLETEDKTKEFELEDSDVKNHPARQSFMVTQNTGSGDFLAHVIEGYQRGDEEKEIALHRPYRASDYEDDTAAEDSLLEHSPPDFEVMKRAAIHEMHINKGRIKLLACLRILVGLGLVIVIAEEMVDAITELASLIGINAFYLSFVVIPVAANSSELFSSFFFAGRKKKETTSLLHASLYGAVAMNNTLSLGVFLGMIYWQTLAWEFLPQTVSISVICLLVCGFGSATRTIRVVHVLWVGALYAVSIVIVVIVRNLQ